MSDTGGVVLLYHRVAAVPLDPQLLAVSPENFSEQMRWLAETMQPTRLSEMAARPKPPQGSVAVTFDDGYLDNLIEAEPILRRFEIPATVFVAGDVSKPRGDFFWDALEDLLLHTEQLPTELKIRVGSAQYEIFLGEHAELTRDQQAAHRTWNVMRLDDPTPRHQGYRQLCDMLRVQTVVERRACIETLRKWAGQTVPPKSSDRLLDAGHLRTLAGSALIDIGAHTVNHPLLGAETIENQRREIVQSKKLLESETGRPVLSFSYPFGTADAFTPDTVKLVESAGFEFACANYPRRLGPKTARFRLPRFVVRDWPLDEFKAQLNRWISAPVADY